MTTTTPFTAAQEPERAQEAAPVGARCSINGCARAAKAKGLCASHYMKMWRHGDPEGGPRARSADLVSPLLAERERLRTFALAYRRQMEVGIAGMTDEEIQTLRRAWEAASQALEASHEP